MSRNYDNWERLVAAALKKQQFRELAVAPSRETSFSSSVAASFDTPFNFKFGPALNDGLAMSYFNTAIQLADHTVRISKYITKFKQECSDIKSKAENIAMLLSRAAHENHKLYERPVRWVMDTTVNVLKKTISWVLKCRGLKGVFSSITCASLQNIALELEHCIGNICWLLRDDQYQGIPPIAADEPVLRHIWELIGILHTGSVDGRCNAAVSLIALGNESDAYRKLIIEEGGGVVQNPRVMDEMVSSIFMEILKGSLQLQGTMASAVLKLVENFLNYFLKFDGYNNFVSLVHNRAFETLLEDCKVFLASAAFIDVYRRRGGTDSVYKTRRLIPEEPKMESLLSTDEHIMELASRELLVLTRMEKNYQGLKGGAKALMRVAGAKAFMCFELFLEKGPMEARDYSVMALMRIMEIQLTPTKTIYVNGELHTTGFSLECTEETLYQRVIDLSIRIIIKAESETRVTCLKGIGNLACKLHMVGTRMISPIVRLLDGWNTEVSKEACIALIKSANYMSLLEGLEGNYLCCSKAILDAGGVKVLVHLCYYSETKPEVRRPALLLLCHIALIVPTEINLAHPEVLSLLELISKQPTFCRGEEIKSLLPQAIKRLHMMS